MVGKRTLLREKIETAKRKRHDNLTSSNESAETNLEQEILNVTQPMQVQSKIVLDRGSIEQLMGQKVVLIPKSEGSDKLNLAYTELSPALRGFVLDMETSCEKESDFDCLAYKSIVDILKYTEEVKMKMRRKNRIQELKDEAIRKSIETLENEGMEASSCPVCYESELTSDSMMVTSCGHSICKKCFRSLKNTKCPSCRFDLELDVVRMKKVKKMQARRQNSARIANATANQQIVFM